LGVGAIDLDAGVSLMEALSNQAAASCMDRVGNRYWTPEQRGVYGAHQCDSWFRFGAVYPATAQAVRAICSVHK
jgi:hypothetical protein